MNLTDRTTASTVLSTFGALGVKPPKDLATAFTRAETIHRKLPHLGGQPGGLERAVAAAILAGREPASDPAVHNALAGQQLQSNRALEDAVASAAHEGIRDACVAHLDAIVSEWRKPFDQAAEILATAHGRIGNLPLEDTTSILAKGGDVAEVWASAKSADGTINTAVNGWVNLMRLVHVSLNPDHRALKLAAITRAQWLELPAKLTAWEALCAGLTLSLPTLDEYRRRVAALETARAAEAAPTHEPDRERVAMQEWTGRVNKSRASV